MDGVSAIHWDASALLEYFRHNRTPMGVARVQMALLEAGLAAPALFRLVARRPGGFRAMDPASLLELVAASRAGGRFDDADWLALRARVEAALDAAPPAAPAPGDRLLLPAFAATEDLRHARALADAHGAVLAALFYDAIPLTHPEHLPDDVARGFAALFTATCLQADRVVAISDHSAREFRQFQRDVLPALDLPVGVMRLDAPFPAVAPGRLPPPLGDGRPFVLCVSTLESRKDQPLLLRAWRGLVRRHGRDAVPDLVLAGRAGFGAEPALRLLRHAPELQGKAHWLPRLGDAALSALYGAARFCVFNSFAEGWGLPVTEALAHGRLVLAPDHTSLREAGGEAALYFPPSDEAALMDLVWSLAADPARLAALEARARERFRPRAWREVAEALAATLAEDHPPPPPPRARAPLPIGLPVPVAVPARPGAGPPPAAALLAEALRRGEAWGELEPSGAWILAAPEGAGPVLELPLRAGLEAPRLLLDVIGAPGPCRVQLRAVAPSGAATPWQEAELGADSAQILLVDFPPCGAGTARLELDVPEGATAPGDARALGPKLRGLMLCEAEDVSAQLRFFMERAGVHAFQRPPP